MTRRTAAIAGAVTSLCAALAASAFVARSTASTSEPTAVPILMYHVITAPPPGATYPALFVSRPEFAAQMRWLASHGYHAVTLREVYKSWRSRSQLPPRPIVLTFDDGYRSVHTNALPILRSHRWSGVLNLTVRNNGGVGGLSTWKIHQLLAAGWELDSHSLTHPDLTRLPSRELEAQVSGSRRVLQRRFRTRVDFFCYPSGRYDDSVVAAVKAAGYLGATTTRHGLARANEAYVLARVRVDAGESGGDLGEKLHALGA
jgi:peptidoglycan/xylan/chitin deacetylase (PgdA/CDA1 family)